MRELVAAEPPWFPVLVDLRGARCEWREFAPICKSVTQKSQDGPSAMTLGDLLYADRASSPITEHTWVVLVQAIAAGDQHSLRTLYEMSHRIVFTLAMRICSRREIAEEVMLDVFHDVWRRAAQYDPENGTVVGWIMIQTRSRALDRLRFEQRKKRDPKSDPPSDTEDAVTSGPGDALDASDRRRSLNDALSTLTAAEREAVETAFFSELTYSETAARLDQPIGTVKTRVRSALAKLRKALAKEGDQP